MTRVFNQTITCPHCGKDHRAESAFSSWVRDHPQMDSANGHAVCDIDCDVQQIISHKFKDVEVMMLIEIKTRGADLTASQRDTLAMYNQLVRNRRATPTKKVRWQSGTAPLLAYSTQKQRRVWVRMLGCHVLRLSGTSPGDSTWMKWDGQLVDMRVLIGLLQGRLDPDTLAPLSARSHHRQAELPLLGMLFFGGAA